MQDCLLERDIDKNAFSRLGKQDWCQEWQAWTEIQEDMTNESMRAWVSKFLRLALQDKNATVQRGTNKQRLTHLAREGFTCHKASPRGNNCLIDSLAIGLAAEALFRQSLWRTVTREARLVANVDKC